MICEFCNKPCRLSHKENEDKEDKSNYTAVYDCRNCPVLTSFYIDNKNGFKIKTVFMLDRNEKVYMWTDHFGKQVSYITDVGVTLAAKGGNPLVFAFPKLMNVKPTNVHDKFKFYMLFL